LLANAPMNGIYSHPLWLALMAQTVSFGAGAQNGIALLRQSSDIRAALPLVLQAGQLQSWANFYVARAAPVFAGQALDAQDWAALFAGLPRTAGRVPRFNLGPWPRPLAHAAAVHAGARAAGLALRPHFRFGNWHWGVDQGWGEYWRTRSSTLRNTVERKQRSFLRAGGRLVLHTGAEGLDAAIAAYTHIYARSWKPAELHPAFMPGLLRLAAQQGWLRLGLAWLGDEPVAAQIWLVHEGRADIYKLAHQEAHAHRGCGSVLTALLMAHALETDRVHTVDYGMGDEPYKQAWTPQRQEMWGLEGAPVWSAAGLKLQLRARLHRWVAGRQTPTHQKDEELLP
jgi:hypothetical protein